MIDPKGLYEFLVHLAEKMREEGKSDLASELNLASKHFLSSLTSEFYGTSMLALKRTLASHSDSLSKEDRGFANRYTKEIEEKWFRPTR